MMVWGQVYQQNAKQTDPNSHTTDDAPSVCDEIARRHFPSQKPT